MADVCTLLGPFYLPSSKGPYSGLKDMDLSSNGLPSVQEVAELNPPVVHFVNCNNTSS